MPREKAIHLWLLSDGKAGHINQLRALARVMNAGYIEINVRKQDFDFQAFQGKNPDLILSIARAGRKAQIALHQKYPKRLAKVKRVHIMAQKKPHPLFDAEVIMAHDVPQDYIPKPCQILCTLPPSMFGIDKAEMRTPPPQGERTITVLLGGVAKDFRFDQNSGVQLGKKIRKILHKQNVKLRISPSRRTPESVVSAFISALGDTRHDLWDHSGHNPYADMIAQAEAVIVTEDSISMQSDVVHAGKPLYIAELKTKFLRKGRKHRRYRDDLIARGYARILDAECAPFATPECDATRELAQKIMLACGLSSGV